MLSKRYLTTWKSQNMIHAKKVIPFLVLACPCWDVSDNCKTVFTDPNLDKQNLCYAKQGSRVRANFLHLLPVIF